MRIRFRNKTLALTTPLALALALAACAGESEGANAGEDDLPESMVETEEGDVTGEEIADAVPGIEEADPEGDTPNTAGINSEEDAEYLDPSENPPQQ